MAEAETSKSLKTTLCCPTCRAPLDLTLEQHAVCNGAERHQFGIEDDVLVFARPEVGKYDDSYAKQYAALWAYGFETLHQGGNESLYRSVASLVAESLAKRASNAAAIVVDCGCGVGRTTADCACLVRDGCVVGIDASPAMLEIASAVVCGSEPTSVDLSPYGFGRLEIPHRGCRNVAMLRADVQDLPIADKTADIALSVNVVDRLPHGPRDALSECHRILKPGGSLVFTDPMNWQEASHWRDMPDAHAMLNLIKECGFTIRIWFDDLRYREVLDVRGSVEEFSTLVVLAVKT